MCVLWFFETVPIIKTQSHYRTQDGKASPSYEQPCKQAFVVYLTARVPSLSFGFDRKRPAFDQLLHAKCSIFPFLGAEHYQTLETALTKVGQHYPQVSFPILGSVTRSRFRGEKKLSNHCVHSKTELQLAVHIRRDSRFF